MSNTMGTKGPTITGSAAIHAERIRARDAERAAEVKERDGRQTAEIYGERVLAGYRADEELRRQADLNARRARGQWVPGDEPDDDTESEVEETAEFDFDPTDSPERRAAKVAWRSASTGGYLAL
jgi:hypothetical protein